MRQKKDSLSEGADLTQIVNDAIEIAIERSFELGDLQPLSNDDLQQATKKKHGLQIIEANWSFQGNI